MGRLHVVAGRALGAGTIVVVDRNPERLAHARTLGADVTLAPSDDIAAAVGAATDGRGADVAAVTIGDTSAARGALASLARGGRLNLFAGFGADQGPLAVDANAFHYRGLKLVGTTGASMTTLAHTLALLAGGRLHLGGMVSATFDLSEAMRAFEAAGQGGHARVVLLPGRGTPP
jgi:L-iditol 2-dehydrogenase